MESSRGKVPTLRACQQSCADATGCKSITYFKSKWCTHWSTLCTKTKWNKKAVMSAKVARGATRTWTELGPNLECDGKAGEVYLESSRGRVPTVQACRQSCEDITGCKSISYFKSGWCTHWSTDCTNTKPNKKVRMSLRSEPDALLRGAAFQVRRNLRGV